LIFGALVPLAVAATAWACGVLATLKVDSSVASPGQTLTVSGINYSDSAQFTPVQIRWNSRTGPVLKEVSTVGGRFSTTVQVPGNAAPGWYVLNGTQYNIANGTPKSGTPGRTTLRVQGAGAGAASPWSSGPGGAAVPVDGGPGGPPLVPTLLGVMLSLGLLGSGLTLVSRSRTRKANRPLLGV
jgi:hypothetical protein